MLHAYMRPGLLIKTNNFSVPDSFLFCFILLANLPNPKPITKKKIENQIPTSVSPLTALTGLKAQTWSPWSPWSPLHHPLYHQRRRHTVIPNQKTPIRPIRRASMVNSKKDVESCIFHLVRRTKTKMRNLRGSSLSFDDTVSVKSNPF